MLLTFWGLFRVFLFKHDALHNQRCIDAQQYFLWRQQETREAFIHTVMSKLCTPATEAHIYELCQTLARLVVRIVYHAKL